MKKASVTRLRDWANNKAATTKLKKQSLSPVNIIYFIFGSFAEFSISELGKYWAIPPPPVPHHMHWHTDAEQLLQADSWMIGQWIMVWVPVTSCKSWRYQVWPWARAGSMSDAAISRVTARGVSEVLGRVSHQPWALALDTYFTVVCLPELALPS